jgi:hypothetical protein
MDMIYICGIYVRVVLCSCIRRTTDVQTQCVTTIALKLTGRSRGSCCIPDFRLKDPIEGSARQSLFEHRRL